MAILNNVGHNDHSAFTPERDNMPRLTEAWEKWRRDGTTPQDFEPKADSAENLGCPFQSFVIPAEDLHRNRLDAFYYAPDLKRTRQDLHKRAAAGHIKFLPGRDLEIAPTLKKEKQAECRGQIFRYFEIGDVPPDGTIVKYREDFFEQLPSRAKLQVKTGDVLFARNNSSRGTAIIAPPEFDGQLTTTGCIAVRPANCEQSRLLWRIFTAVAELVIPGRLPPV